jgi:rRNA maturation endonuclease Nob1
MARPLKPRKKTNPRWTEADREKIVVMLTDGQSVQNVAKKLGRTVAAIQLQAVKLRVSCTSNLKQRAMRIEGMRRRS